jgi:hypothetical protein
LPRKALQRCYVADVAEHEPPEFEQCGVCGRTALRGERLWDYVTPGGERRRVCVLCKPQAEAAGWLPAELAASRAEQAPRPSRARALRERLARAAESARARPVAEPAPAGEDEAPPPRRRRRLIVERPDPVDDDGGEPARGERSGPRERRRREAAPADSSRHTRSAVDRFNASEASRTVAGLIRSLGEPQASIQLGGRGKPATVTVAWELSWYQWAIDPGAHGAVREVGKGKEIGELSEADRRWNARIADDGSLRLQSV